MATASTERDRVAPVLVAALLGLLGWIALSIHEMNARLGVVETRLIAVEESQTELRKGQAELRKGLAKLETGQAQAGAERQALERRIGDVARRLPPPR